MCPGSREAEINKHLPVLEEVVYKQNQLNKKVIFNIVVAPGISLKYFKNLISNFNNVKIIEQPLLGALKISDLAIIASGTATLECATTKTPMIVIYKMSGLSWFITKRFIKTPFAAIINIIANKKLVPELLQKDLTSHNIIKHINSIMQSKNLNRISSEMDSLLASLDEGNSHKKAGNFILNYEK